MTFGERLVKIREDVGISQKDLAIRLDMAPQAYGRYEKDKNVPTVSVIEKLANIFSDKQILFLITGVEKELTVANIEAAENESVSPCDRKLQNEIIQILKYAPKPFLEKIKAKLMEFKRISDSL